MSVIKYRNSSSDSWQDLTVVVGPQGPAGATGATGPAGADGADGNGIASIVLNNDYTLTITYTDGTNTTTGSIRGPQGEQGPTGPAGTYTAGTNITIENGVISATSGGGATYTAGTGISIDANGVISLALANASQEEM